MVAGLCRALLRDPAEAEDAAQQTFLSAHRSVLNGAVPREPGAWLATIARNECWSRISARMREPLATETADDVAGDADPVAEAIRRADLAALWRAIRALPAPQREALLLREFGGLRYDELAAALAVTEPAVESLLFRARTRLRAQLQAAYAALTGVSWLDPLARLVAGGGAPALATKAVALGIGTAAVTGTAVIVPKVVQPHGARSAHAAEPRAHLRHARAVAHAAPEAAAEAVDVVRHVPAKPRVPTARRVQTERAREVERQAAPATEPRVEVEPRVEPRTEPRVESTEEPTVTTTTATSDRHGGTGTDSHDGGRVTTTTANAATTTTEGTAEATTTTESHDGSGGHGGGETTTTVTTTADIAVVTTSGGDSHGGGSGSGSDSGSGSGR